MKNRFFWGHIISTLPKTYGNVRRSSGRPMGEIWSTKFTSVDAKNVSKKFRFWGLTSKPEVVFAIFLAPFCRSLPDVVYGEETKHS